MSNDTAVGGCVFTSLPNEVLELILHSEQIDHVSLSQLSLVCRRLNILICSNKIWNIQAKKRWKVWRYCGRKISLKRKDSLDIPGVVEWRDLFVSRFLCERAVNSFLDRIADDYLLLEKDNGIVDDSKIEGAMVTLMEHEYVMETLRELIDDGDCSRNISRKFYAPSVYTYFKLKRLMLSFPSVFGEDISSFCKSMEPISIWLDRWMNPLDDLEYFDYSIEFDRLAERTRRVLPNGASQWDVISAIDGVMFKEEGYRVNDNFYSHTNSYLHHVIKRKQGIYVTLAVIFQAVASRLGLTLFPVSFPGSFVLGYEEYNDTFVDESLQSRTQFITFVEGNRVRKISDQELNFTQTLVNRSSFMNLSSVHIVTTRMLANISLNLINKEPNGEVNERLAFIRATELLLKFNKSIDRRIQQCLFNACNFLNYNLDKYSIKFNGERSTDGTVRYVRRQTHEMDSEIQEYPIGLIVRLKDAPDLVGVVYRWNRISNNTVSYCSILLDNKDIDLQSRHEDLTPILTPHYGPIANPLIGKYFSQFNGHYYQPIALLRQIYPDDETAMQTLFPNL